MFDTQFLNTSSQHFFQKILRIRYRAARGARRYASALATLGFVGLFGSAQAQTPPACELKRPVVFGMHNWESNMVLVEIERFIMEKGYGCATEAISVESLPGLAALERGDVDISAELWLNSIADYWYKAEATGRVKSVGSLFAGGESWFIPRYTAERFPELKRVSDLPKYKDHFKDPEDPGKGRIYGCPAGWACEVVTTNQAKGLGLLDSFNIFSPGSGAAQKAVLSAAYQRKEDVVFYYWYPTPLVGAMDLVALEFPPHDAATYRCQSDPDCPNPVASAYPDNPVSTSVNSQFAEQAPTLMAFLSRVTLPLDVINKVLAYMEETQSEADAVAQWFFQQYDAVWTQWLPEEVAARVKAAL